MLLIQVLLISILLTTILPLLGWIPACYFSDRLNRPTPGFLLFLSLFFGYLLVQSLFAIWITNGITIQWLNFLPFLMVAKSGARAGGPLFNMVRLSGKDILLSSLMLLVSSVYFVRSYSNDFTNIHRQPFVDLVSYAASAYGMGQSGIEAYFADKALYFPELSGINLYHFTELWLTKLLALVTGKTELWITCFILPVFQLNMVVMALISLPGFRKEKWWMQFLMLLAFCFSFGKLLFFEDVFLYHILDLFGSKLALILPAFVIIWSLRRNLMLLLTSLLFLPQLNILLFPLCLILAFNSFYRGINFHNEFPMKQLVTGYSLYLFFFLLILFLGRDSGSAGLNLQAVEGFHFLRIFFQYGREAIYNLGFWYWMPFIFLAFLFKSRIYGLIFLPFLFGKAFGKLISLMGAGLIDFVPGAEFVVCIAGFWWLNKKWLRFNKQIQFAFRAIFALCMVAACGYAFSGFMDFEQIFTLPSGSFFFLIAFGLFILPAPLKHPPILSFKGSEYLLAASLIALTWSTYRFQRSLPFDESFYKTIESEAGPVSKSIYFSSKHFAPFPLHVKTGYPLLFSSNDAYSTPVTQFEDSSWHGKNIAWHVRQYPFYIFCELPENKYLSMQQKTLLFLKKFGIWFVWIDQTYPQSRLKFLKPFVEKRWVSNIEQKEFWKINPAKIPAKNSAAPASSEK